MGLDRVNYNFKRYLKSTYRSGFIQKASKLFFWLRQQDGVGTAYMIRKGQLAMESIPSFKVTCQS
jgi:hypothetical protein